MISEVVMPQMGADMVEGTIVRWLKSEGDAIERGEIIAEIETDKANVEIEAFESGVFRKALAQEGDVIPVGGLIGIIAAADEDISKYETATAAAATVGAQPAAPSAPTIPPTPTKATARGVGAPLAAPSTAAQTSPGTTASAAPVPPSPTTAAAPAPPTNGRLRASPVARRMAEERGVDLNTIHGTGPDGRIIKRDIESAMAAVGAPPAAPSSARSFAAAPAPNDQRPTAIPQSKMRQTIARRMSQSKREAPHYYLLLDIDMTAALELRAQYNDALASGDIAGPAPVGAQPAAPNSPADTRVSINDMLVRAAALALRKHPEFNATIDGETITQHPRQNVCIGIALDEGLIAPALLDAADKTLAQIAAESKDLSARAKGGRLKPPELQDGTFTITNLGAYGIETLVGIIQPPQTAILGVGTVTPQPAVRDGQVVVRQMMKVALSADHRVTDGAQGAQFLSELKRLLENPLLLAV